MRTLSLTGAAPPTFTLFADEPMAGWVLWDCCAGSVPASVTDDADHGEVAEFSVGATPTVLGIITRSANGGGDQPIDATALAESGVLRFEMKMVSAPNDAAAPWLLKRQPRRKLLPALPPPRDAAASRSLP